MERRPNSSYFYQGHQFHVIIFLALFIFCGLLTVNLIFVIVADVVGQLEKP